MNKFFEETLVIDPIREAIVAHPIRVYYIFALLILLLIALIFTVAVYANDPICKYRITFARALGAVQQQHIAQIETNFTAAELDKYLVPAKSDPTIYEIRDQAGLIKFIGLKILDPVSGTPVSPILINITPMTDTKFKLFVAYPKIKIESSNRITNIRDVLGNRLAATDGAYYL